jgi:hypothetical protein
MSDVPLAVGMPRSLSAAAMARGDGPELRPPAADQLSDHLIHGYPQPAGADALPNLTESEGRS